MRLLILFIFLFALPATAAELQFSTFPAKSIFHGVPARVDVASAPASRLFGTRLREGAAKGPNYAGNLTVVTWGCGTECQTVAVVSAQSGNILTFLQTCAGVTYKLESSLLILNPSDPVAVNPSYCTTQYYVWTGHQLKRIKSPPKSG